MFDFQPALRGSLVELRPLRASDFESLYCVASDPLIWEQHPDKTRCERAAFTRYFEKAMLSGGTLLALATDGGTIGCSRFHTYREQEGEVTIGYTFLSRSYWGGSYNGEMKRLMLTHAFRFVPKVMFRVAEHNMRSRRAVEKLRAVLMGRENYQQFGQTHVIYQIDRGQYLRTCAQ
jgi:RimJ/RimL family protein N-acetyltransferase